MAPAFHLLRETGGPRNENKKERHRGEQAAPPLPHGRLSGGIGAQKKKSRGGRCKSLIRLDSDKEIKVNSFDFLVSGFAGFGPGLVEFGFALGRPS
jgi:hypothetical protein